MLLPGLFINPIVNGTPLPLPQNAIYDFDPVRGYIVRQEYDGVSQEAMLSLQQQYVLNGIACRLTFAQGRAKLEIDDSTQEYTLDSWGLGGEDEAVDVLLHPQVAADLATAGITYSTGIAALQTHLQNQDNQATAFGQPGSGSTLAPLIGSLTYYLYPYILAGLTSFKSSAVSDTGYVLRHKTNVSNRYTDNIADYGVGQIYTTAQLLSEVTDSGLWAVPLPIRLAYKVSMLMPPNLPSDIAGDWLIGWFKGRSTEDTAANNRVDIETSYTYGQFERALYSQYDG